MPSSLGLIISSFWFKVRDMWLFLSLEHLEAILRLGTGLASILFCLREYGALRGDRKMGKWPVGRWSSQNTHSTYQLSPLPYMGVVHSVLKQFTIVASMITGHHKRYNNDEKVWNIGRITQMCNRDTKWPNAVRKMVLIDLLDRVDTNLQCVQNTVLRAIQRVSATCDTAHVCYVQYSEA